MDNIITENNHFKDTPNFIDDGANVIDMDVTASNTNNVQMNQDGNRNENEVSLSSMKITVFIQIILLMNFKKFAFVK